MVVQKVIEKSIEIAFFNSECNHIQFARVSDVLKTYYDLIGCDTIDITTLYGMNVIVDDNGLYRENYRIAYINTDIMLVGVIVFAGCTDSDGNLTSLSEKNILCLKELDKLVRVHCYVRGVPLYSIVVNNIDDRRIYRMVG